MSERSRGILFVLIAATIWSIGGLGIKVIQTDAMAISGYRSFFAIPVLLIWLIGKASNKLPAFGSSLQRPWVWAAALSYALTLTCFVVATKLTTAANTILLQSMAPIYVALLSWPLLKERIRGLDWLAIAGCLLGMLFFFRDQLSPAGFTGNIVAIIAGVGFAGITLFLRLDQLKMSQQHGPGHSAHVSAVVSVALGNILAALIGLPWMISSPPPTVAGWLVVVGLGMVQIALAYLFFTAGVARLTAIESTLLALVEPILNPIWVALGTGETPSRSALIGGTMIVASVTVRGILQSLSPKLKPARS